jgi:hypothetical protein
MLILDLIFEKWVWVCGLESAEDGVRWRSLVKSYEPMDCIKDMECFDELSDYQLLKDGIGGY